MAQACDTARREPTRLVSPSSDHETRHHPIHQDPSDPSLVLIFSDAGLYHAMNFLKPVQEKHPWISHADLWTCTLFPSTSHPSLSLPSEPLLCFHIMQWRE